MRISTSEPKNEGRIFQVWCGARYTFTRNDAGALCLEPYWDKWTYFTTFDRLHKEMVESLDPYFDKAAGLAEVLRRARREAKARTFHARYAGSLDHRWRTQVPHENGIGGTVTGRLIIHDIPFQF